ncbi:MAG: glycosyltransferase family 4 protein [Minisyncoccales bacterium]
MKILIINTTKRKYGGKVYEGMVEKILSESFKTETIVFTKKNFLFKIWQASRRKDVEITIRNFDSCLFFNPRPVKNIALVHHIDFSFSPLLVKTVFFFLTPLIFRNLRKADAIVVVSKYWEKFFKERGYKNVYLIYNAFNLDELSISDREIEEFKKKYNLIGKPIIYLGNCQKAKGVVESYKALKNLDCHLVTSGKPMVKIPARNLEIEYRDYLKLLKASSIAVTMSRFKEGWCRTAHEAMLLKTPVIGSGLGGMRELLEGGKQMTCEDFGSLRERVEYLLAHPEIREKMGEDGYNFAKDFTLERFKKEWLELINKLI